MDEKAMKQKQKEGERTLMTCDRKSLKVKARYFSCPLGSTPAIKFVFFWLPVQTRRQPDAPLVFQIIGN
ncbi:hypothetical protein SK128_007299 [Halocaridina rubra]|uniref:Uncharacterized protein n=1 Tax=Halocaridina rubra TaxID=373956 RepID=A0AAN8ZYA4_HALRR